MKAMHKICFIWLVAALLACSGCSGGDPVEDARRALAAGEYTTAEQRARDGLNAVGSDPKARWPIERIRVEALAKGKMGDEAARTLDRLANEYPSQANASLYMVTAEWLREARDSASATTILDAGKKRFPQEAQQFVDAIEKIKKQPESAMDPATIERLRSLGYLD